MAHIKMKFNKGGQYYIDKNGKKVPGVMKIKKPKKPVESEEKK